MEPKGRTECSGAWSRWAAGEGLAGEQHRLCPPWGSAQGQDDIDGQILGQLHPPAEGEGEAGPAFPGMGSEELRLASFYSWPPTTGVRPELLAAAGFFHTGRQDKVRCFFCYGGLQSWEQGDDPWIEHAKWFPRCQFLLQSKGRAFVHSVQQSPPHLSSWGLWEEPEDAAPHTLSAAVHEGPELPTPCTEIQSENAREPGAGDAAEQLRRLQEERTCKVCLDRAVRVVFVPCGHLACAECAPSLQLCPICRAPVRSYVRTFLS
ncbi:baculoviral IAP repeat-containing protein 7 isoform X3 [Tupaia chinensis]|uniref:baculoviral IAP repeat-containing protein 7 isoform X3 n=1 Tax=Tupaia chinensis TaxID=246437 RepID=UPI0003C918AC|nr:baculoviral IAP repeat-containing protein 7 isoform X3 [Tupaia chinensis]XP_006167106.1 baculoviral IAP repeat-containing protein 7 isoform X3 [Tupaia chinensis]